MITGNEMIRVLMGLLGIPDPYGPSKSEPLPDVQDLVEKEVVLRFAVGTNWGRAALTKFLTDRDLPNVRVDGRTTTWLDVLTEEGLAALSDGSLLDQDGCVVDPTSRVRHLAFEDLRIWTSKEKRSRALAFCQAVGRQLYAQFQDSKSRTPPERWVEEAGLGVSGLALALAFSHSVPKSTLPLFWATGSVKFRGRPFKWQPLFPNAQ